MNIPSCLHAYLTNMLRIFEHDLGEEEEAVEEE